MPIEFPCPICHQQVRTPDAAAGKKGKCPNCGTLVLIPAPVVVLPPTGAVPKPTIESPSKSRPPDPARMPPRHDLAPPKPATSPPPAAPAGSIEFACPDCHQTVRTPTAAAGKKGHCPHCHALVQIPVPATEPAPKTPPQPSSQPPAEGRKETGEKAAKAPAPAAPGSPHAPAAPHSPVKSATKLFPAPSNGNVTSKSANAPHPDAPAPTSTSAKPAATPAKPAAPTKPAPAPKHLPVAKPLPTPPIAAKPAAKADPEILDLEELPAGKQGTPGLTPLGSGLTPLGGGLTPLGGGLTALGGGLIPVGPAPAALSGLTPLGPAPPAPPAPDPLAGLTPLSAYPAVTAPPPNPLGAPASPFGPSTNPYAAPAASVYGQPVYQTRTVSDAHRRGLPWERDPSMEAFNDTMSLVLGSPQEAFSVMRRTGGVGNPIGFMIIGMVIGQIANAIYYGFIGGFLQAAASEHPMNVEAIILVGVAQLVGGVIGAVIFAPILSFVIAGVYHLLLVMVGGANAGYEATFRSVCFVNGSTSILLAIPCIGPFLAFFFSIVCMIHAFANAHETSGGKAAFSVLGVLFGLFVCSCGCGIMFFLPAMASAMNQLP